MFILDSLHFTANVVGKACLVYLAHQLASK